MHSPTGRLLKESRRRLGIFLLLVLSLAFVLASSTSPAAAHPILLETLPQAGFSYSEPPAQIGLVLDEPVSVQRLKVLGQARGPIRTSTPSRSPDGTTVTVTPSEPLPDGNYTVHWQITAQDGDIVDGTFTFSVGVAPEATARTTASSDTVGSAAVTIFRWVLFGGLALAFGGLAGDSMVRDRARRAKQRSELDLPIPRPWVFSGSVLGLIAVAALALVQTGGGDLSEGARGFSLRTLVSSEVGRLLIAEAIGFMLSALAALGSHRRVALAGLLTIIAAEAWRSHLHAQSGLLGSATIAVHLAVAALWVGTLTHLVRATILWRDSRRQVVAIFRRYARFALIGYLLVVGTGTVAAILVIPSWAAMASTTYGRILLVKLGALAAVTALALAAHRGVRRSMSTYEWKGMRFARIELAALIGILGASAFLTALSPFPESTDSPFPAPVAGPAVFLGGLAGQVSTGLIAGEGQVQVRLHVPESSSVAVQTYRASAKAVNANGKTLPLTLVGCGNGCFSSQVAWPLGRSTIKLAVEADGWAGGDLDFVIPWPPRDGSPAFQRMLDTMARQPKVLLAEEVTSNTRRPEGMSSRLSVTGAELLRAQPYRSGIVGSVAILGRTGSHTDIGFALSAESIYVRMRLAKDGRIRSEQILTPNHLISRQYTYPDEPSGN